MAPRRHSKRARYATKTASLDLSDGSSIDTTITCSRETLSARPSTNITTSTERRRKTPRVASDFLGKANGHAQKTVVDSSASVKKKRHSSAPHTNSPPPQESRNSQEKRGEERNLHEKVY